MSNDEELVPLNDDRQEHRRPRRGHSPFVINGRPADLQPLKLLQFAEEPPARRWLVDGFIPENNVTTLGGDGGLGKSQLAIQLLASSALGRDWIGLPVRRCKAIGIFCEDDRDELHRRLAAVAKHYGVSVHDLEEDLGLISRVGDDNLLMTWPDAFGTGQETNFLSRLGALIDDFGAELLVLDSLHDLFGGNENSRPHARQFIGALRTLARQMNGAVLLTAHPSLTGRNSGTGEAGSTAWNNAVRSRLYLTAPQRDDDGAPDRDYRELKTMKANYGASGGVIRLRWQDGVFDRDAEGTTPGNIVDKIDLDNAVVETARDLIRDGVKLLANKNATNSLANRARQHECCKAFKWAAIAAAQERLIVAGRLVRIELGPKSRRMVYVRPADARYPGEEA